MTFFVSRIDPDPIIADINTFLFTPVLMRMVNDVRT